MKTETLTWRWRRGRNQIDVPHCPNEQNKARECGWSRTFKLLHIFQYSRNRQENVDIISIKKRVCPFASMLSQTGGKAGMRLERQAAWETLTGNNEDQHNGKVHSKWHFSKSIFNLRTEHIETWNKGLCESPASVATSRTAQRRLIRNNRPQVPGWRLHSVWEVIDRCKVWMKHFGLFASSHSDKQRTERVRPASIHGLGRATKDAARTHIPVCFRSSTQAQSQGFPLSTGGRKRGYNITSFRLEAETGRGKRGGGTPVIHSLKHFLI